jgi:cytochrome c peroxidase
VTWRTASLLAVTWLTSSVCIAAELQQWHLPTGFAEPVVPVDNAMSTARVVLGKQLFRETRLSVTGQFSCASCHDPGRAFTDGRRFAIGARGDALERNAPSLNYSAWNPSLGWDQSGAPTLEQQMLTPLLAEHPVEMGLMNVLAPLLQAFAADPGYATGFAAAFPDEATPVSLHSIVRAIASYERTLATANSAFDRYVFHDDRAAMSVAARRGMALFFGERASCASCHSGMAFSGPLRSVNAEQAQPLFADDGYRARGSADAAATSAHRVPSLRNVAVTAPYMHDGGLPTLAAVIEHYNNGAQAGDRVFPPLHLSDAEKTDLLAFLESLTDQAYAAMQ